MKFNLEIMGNENGIAVAVSNRDELLFNFKADKYHTIGNNTYLFYVNDKCFMRLSGIVNIKIDTTSEHAKIFKF